MAAQRKIWVYEKVLSNGTTGWRAEISDPRNAGTIKRVAVFKGSGVPPSKQGRSGALRRARALFDQWTDEVRHEAEAARQREQSGPTITEFIHRAKKDPGKPKVRDQLAERTVERRGQILDKFRDWITTYAKIKRGGRRVSFGDGPVAEITPTVIDEYGEQLSSEGLKPTGIQRQFATIQRAFNYGLEKKILPRTYENPVIGKSRRKKTHESREEIQLKALTDDEIRRIITACREGQKRTCSVQRGDQRYEIQKTIRPPAYLLPTFQLANETGMRPGELRALQWEHIDFTSGMIQVAHATSKTGARKIPMTDAARTVLRDLKRSLHGRDPSPVYVLARVDGGQLDREQLVKPVVHLFKSLGLTGKSFYGFRHAFGLRLADRGMGIHEIKELMGHSSITTTEIYLKTEAERFASKFRRIMGA